jgi:lantibiotic transport system ATP-binding protein
MNCIETTQLTYHFRKGETVINNINLQVPEGSIYGFLGQNGAGKTTTLRLLLGLLKKQQGTITIFNKPFEKNRIEILAQTGSLIESPSFYAHLSATDNLRILQKVYQCPKERIAEVLAIVGLSNVKNKKVSQFSLGMKQRLSIAIAILHNPKLLILDEPTNGLDPNGIIEIRELIKRINIDFGITIVISSHLLAEVEKLVTHVGIINKGELLFQGTLKELNSKQNNSSSLLITTDNNSKATELLLAHNINVQQHGDAIRIAKPDNTVTAALIKQLVDNNIGVYEVSATKNDLETIFMHLTK